MAKATISKSNVPSRVRFIVLEAELNDGDLSQITQAIQNALTPAPRSISRLTSTAGRPPPAKMLEVEAMEDEQEDQIDPTESVEEPRAIRSKSARSKPRTPKVIELDLKTDISLASYAQSKKTDTDVARNLVIAAWFKLHRGLDEITVDHVYTAYRAMGWPTGITDFAKPLKNLKQRQFFDGKDGSYSINHLGLARVEDPES